MDKYVSNGGKVAAEKLSLILRNLFNQISFDIFRQFPPLRSQGPTR
jgi:hypothetical protein